MLDDREKQIIAKYDEIAQWQDAARCYRAHFRECMRLSRFFARYDAPAVVLSEKLRGKARFWCEAMLTARQMVAELKRK